MRVLIVDYGMGNLGSVRRSFEECGAQVQVSDDPVSVTSAERIVIPGVGVFSEAMQQLRRRGWHETLSEAVLFKHIPILGICLGMQLLADIGEEGAESPGLGFIKGRVVRFSNTGTQERIPHVGWNEVYPMRQSSLFEGIPPGADFFFVHSYHFVAECPEDVLATTPYCGGFVSSVSKANVYGVQFHPEKSSRTGFRLITNFLTV